LCKLDRTGSVSSRGDRAVLTLLLACSALGGCDRGPTEFRCRTPAQCTLAGVAGTCESDGHCSFPDGACPAARRYGRHAPPALAGRCVEQPRCGDGRIGPGEECDDGNTADDDGCTSRCVRCGADLGAARFGWPQTGACYVRHDQLATWDEAERSCARDGGHLAAFASIYEESAVYRTLLGDAREPHWIGFAYLGLRKEFAWVTNEPRLIARWGVGRPSASGTQPTCVALSPVPGPDGVTAIATSTAPCTCRSPGSRRRPPVRRWARTWLS